MMDRRLKNTLLMGMAVGVVTNTNMAPPVSAQENEPQRSNMNEVIQAAGHSKTNVVFIVLDDMGFSDFGCYGSEIKTPNIDKLAANGLRYNSFNVCPVCSPTRASLLTGRDHHAVGVATVAIADSGPEVPNQRSHITPSAATIAQILKENDYSTFGVGKWHLVPQYQMRPAGPYENWPLGKGFERYYGFLGGYTNQYYPELIYDNHYIEVPTREGYHVSEDLIDNAISFVTDQNLATPDKPYFLYVAFGAVHSPIQVPKKYTDMYKGVYDEGWDKIRQERFQRQKEIGIIPADTELAPRDPSVQNWDTLSDTEKRVFARFQEVYAGFLTHTDEQIGRLIEFLKTTGQIENTIIVLISDNGAVGDLLKGSSHGHIRGTYDPPVADLLPRLDEMGEATTQIQYNRGWAMVSNTPFQKYKGDVYGGGICVPLIVHWPEGIKSKGEIRTQYSHISDITPTILDILDITPPKIYHEIEQMPMHGISLLYSFNDADAPSRRDTLYYYALQNYGNRSVYYNGWKAIAVHTSGEPYEKDVWELYHVSDDYAEARDIAAQHPDKLKELKDLWFTEAGKYGVLPLERKATSRYIPPGETADRSKWTYYPGPGIEGIIQEGDLPGVRGSFTITVPVSRKDKSQDGVLVALGDNINGYTFFVMNNHLVFESKRNEETLCRIESSAEVPTGPSTLKFEFASPAPAGGMGRGGAPAEMEPGGPGGMGPASSGGTGRLLINDRIVAEEEMPSPSGMMSARMGIGWDPYLQVSKLYQGKGGFPFSGELQSVTFELKKDQ